MQRQPGNGYRRCDDTNVGPGVENARCQSPFAFGKPLSHRFDTSRVIARFAHPQAEAGNGQPTHRPDKHHRNARQRPYQNGQTEPPTSACLINQPAEQDKPDGISPFKGRIDKTHLNLELLHIGRGQWLVEGDVKHFFSERLIQHRERKYRTVDVVDSGGQTQQPDNKPPKITSGPGTGSSSR